MTERKKKTTPKRISDVAGPNKTAPADTSRPVIATNRPLLKDPMMTDSADPGSEPATATAAIATTERENKITPLEEVEPSAEPPTPEPPAAAPEEPPEAPATEPAAATETPSAPADTTDEADTTLQKNPDAEAEAEAEQQAQHEAAIQKLIDSKQYYLSINSVEKRRTKRFVALGVVLSLVLALAWVDVALDANLIHVANIKPVTHFFSS